MSVEPLLSIKEACDYAREAYGKDVSPSNLSYLVNYARLPAVKRGGMVCIAKRDLMTYFQSLQAREVSWKDSLGADVIWQLSFDNYREKERTKHVHRLHPYKGKFIPQLVEYFIDEHVDEIKRDVFFQKGDVILDPFCGSGTTLVQANECGMHAIGIDVSSFNAMIANGKVIGVDVRGLQETLVGLHERLCHFHDSLGFDLFDKEVGSALQEYNVRYFPSPDYKRLVREGKVQEASYSSAKLKDFMVIYRNLVAKHGVDLLQHKGDSFLSTWYLLPVRRELDFLAGLIGGIQDKRTQHLARIVLSRVARSCRATTHADLATLKEPQIEPYYCAKHGKICRPLLSAVSWWQRYSVDTVQRLLSFESVKTKTHQHCLVGDARTMDLACALEKAGQRTLCERARTQTINGIFCSPPYVGVIDYHQQHAYAYELFAMKRQDHLEIGPLTSGQGRLAREDYVAGLVRVLRNCCSYLVADAPIFLVANDKWGLYPHIAEQAGLEIQQDYRRPVLNRTEKNRGQAYGESVFLMKVKKNGAKKA